MPTFAADLSEVPAVAVELGGVVDVPQPAQTCAIVSVSGTPKGPRRVRVGPWWLRAPDASDGQNRKSPRGAHSLVGYVMEREEELWG